MGPVADTSSTSSALIIMYISALIMDTMGPVPDTSSTSSALIIIIQWDQLLIPPPQVVLLIIIIHLWMGLYHNNYTTCGQLLIPPPQVVL